MSEPQRVQPADIEPETTRGTGSGANWQRSAGFTFPERYPWSQIGPEFIRAWGRDDTGKEDPEHVEGVGPTGSGKTYTVCTMLQDRMRARKTGAVFICTKPADATVRKLGWPIVDTWDQVRQEPNCVFWPRTHRMGLARKQYHEQKIGDLLHRLWKPEANTIVAFDEIGYVESLSAESRALVQQYWREARSLGITVMGMKQRPQGALRDMHSETHWTFVFPPKDRADTERFAELLGAKRDWVPVLDSLDQDRREFVIRHARSREAYITWVDTPLQPVSTPKRTPKWWHGG